jgi:hypothetical protein
MGGSMSTPSSSSEAKPATANNPAIVKPPGASTTTQSPNVKPPGASSTTQASSNVSIIPPKTGGNYKNHKSRRKYKKQKRSKKNIK